MQDNTVHLEHTLYKKTKKNKKHFHRMKSIQSTCQHVECTVTYHENASMYLKVITAENTGLQMQTLKKEDKKMKKVLG